MTKRAALSLRTIAVVWLIAVSLGEIAYAGVELISNGDFSSGFEAWEKRGYYMQGAGGSTFTPDISIVDDSPNSQAVKLTGVSDRNYYISVRQEVNLSSDSFSSFDISFDWKVTEKESSYGTTYIQIIFLNEEDVRIGYVSYWDTANDAESISYWRGDLEENQFIGVRKYREVFDWENVSVNTSAMTGMEPSQVAKISVGFTIQNDAGSGGIMLVDNFSIVGIENCQPSIDIKLNSNNRVTGDKVIINAQIKGAGSSDSSCEQTQVEQKVWVKLSNDSVIPLIDPFTVLTLLPGDDIDTKIFEYTFSGAEPIGAYQIGGRLLHPFSGDTISTDIEILTFSQ